MHPLEDFIAASGDTIADFARRIGADRATLVEIVRGARAPAPSLARRIVEACGGALEFADLYPRGAAGAAIVDLRARAGEGVRFDAALLAATINEAIAEIARGAGSAATAGPLAPIGAEAAIETYAALASVTTRRDPDRLAQALAPALAEILEEQGLPQPDRKSLGDAALRCARLYFEALKRLPP